MTFEELKNEYYELSIISRNNRNVLLCQNKETFAYEFFYLNSDFICEKVDEPLRKELSKVYHVNTSPDDEYVLTNDIVKSFSKSSIDEKFSSAVSQLKSLTNKYLSEDFINQKIAKLQIGTSNDYYDTYKRPMEADGLSKGSMLYFKTNREEIDVILLSHELLHWLTKDVSKSNCGLKKNIFSVSSEEIVSSCFIGTGINEGATEYYALKYCHDDERTYSANIGYRFDTSIYAYLLERIPSIEKSYFDINFDDFISKVSAYYHVNNQDATKLVLQIDAMHNVMSSDEKYEKKHLNFLDGYCVLRDVYKTIINFTINKYAKENLSVDDLKVEDFICKDLLLDSDIDKINKSIYFDLKKHLCFQKRAKNINNSLVMDLLPISMNFFARTASDIFAERISGDSLPSMYKNPSFYGWMLSKYYTETPARGNYKDFSDDFKDREMDFLIRLFDVKYKFLPMDKNERANCVKSLVLQRKATEYKSLLRFIPDELMVETLDNSLDINFLRNLSIENKDYFNNILPKTKICKTEPRALEFYFRRNLDENNLEKSYEVIENMYDSMDFNVRTNFKLLRVFYQAVYNLQDDKFKTEFKDHIINDVGTNQTASKNIY